jgi:hypothetical protein
MTAAAMLRWLNDHARQVIFQQLAPNRRRKNRVLLTYLGTDSKEIEVIGAPSLCAAVLKAHVRSAAKSTAQPGRAA